MVHQWPMKFYYHEYWKENKSKEVYFLMESNAFKMKREHENDEAFARFARKPKVVCLSLIHTLQIIQIKQLMGKMTLILLIMLIAY